METATLPRWKCIRFCGHEWVGRTSIRPTFCPGCGLRGWWISPEDKPLRKHKRAVKRMYGTVELGQPEHQGHNDECDCERPIVIKSVNDWWHLQDEVREGDYVEITIRRC